MEKSEQNLFLCVKDYLSQLRRHPLPELIDEECLVAFDNVEAQYGHIITYGAGFEVRLMCQGRFVDYILFVDSEDIPLVDGKWVEIDYESFHDARERINECSFINVLCDSSGYQEFFDKVLPSFVGNQRAYRLRPVLNHLVAALFKGVRIKQIGNMSSRGESDTLRLVIMYPDLRTIVDNLPFLGWNGDTSTFFRALKPWENYKSFAINLDISAKGIKEKLGVEIFFRWRKPELVDRVIDCLVVENLCLPSKAQAIKRWIRILPSGEPFIQTRLSYFKLNYINGRIAEAKAYLEQTPYCVHHYFPAYERPLRLDIELIACKEILPFEEVLKRITECISQRVFRIRFFGCEDYERFGQLLEFCHSSNFIIEIVLKKKLSYQCLESFRSIKTSLILIINEIDNFSMFRFLNDLNISCRILWVMSYTNANEFGNFVRRAEATGVKEILVTCDKKDFPNREQLIMVANFIRTRERNGVYNTKLIVESCFSPLKAFLGGRDVKLNNNRGIERGCEAGRSFLAVRANGSLTPCLQLVMSPEFGDLETYWKTSPVLKKLRASSERRTSCACCSYERRCLPCPMLKLPCQLQGV